MGSPVVTLASVENDLMKPLFAMMLPMIAICPESDADSLYAPVASSPDSHR
jgi:hypothetical protein